MIHKLKTTKPVNILLIFTFLLLSPIVSISSSSSNKCTDEGQVYIPPNKKIMKAAKESYQPITKIGKASKKLVGIKYLVDKMMKRAKAYVGTRYVFGGTSPYGFDCTGYVYYIYNSLGIKLPRTIGGQLASGKRVKRNNLMPGDIVYFVNTYKAGLSHVGIYVGNNKFIHASYPPIGVTIDSLGAPYYHSRYYGATRHRKFL